MCCCIHSQLMIALYICSTNQTNCFRHTEACLQKPQVIASVLVDVMSSCVVHGQVRSHLKAHWPSSLRCLRSEMDRGHMSPSRRWTSTMTGSSPNKRWNLCFPRQTFFTLIDELANLFFKWIILYSYHLHLNATTNWENRTKSNEDVVSIWKRHK